MTTPRKMGGCALHSGKSHRFDKIGGSVQPTLEVREMIGDPDRFGALPHFVASQTGLGEWPALVFVDLKAEAQQLARDISRYLPGTKVALPITGDLPLATRQGIADRLRRRDPDLPVCVCTAVWSTGVDVPSVLAVYDATTQSAPIGLVQRPGRGLRLADDKSQCVIYDVRPVGAAGEKRSRRRDQVYRQAGMLLPEDPLLERVLAESEALNAHHGHGAHAGGHRDEVPYMGPPNHGPLPGYAPGILTRIANFYSHGEGFGLTIIAMVLIGALECGG